MRRVLRFGLFAVLALMAGIALLAGTIAGIGPQRRAALHAALMTAELPPRPDYRDPGSWAALPQRSDAADVALVPGTADAQAGAAADVFYLYAGTNWLLRWNAPIDHPVVTTLVDGPYMEQFASVFSGCCRIYAPRYRQEAILRPEGAAAERQRALDVAYADVRAAFRHYLEHWNDGRPVVVAGSQSGGRHALRLLIDEFAGKPLREQLVAAYLAGAHVDAAARVALGDLPICDDAEQTGCFNVWNAHGRQAWGQLEPQDAACVNPLTWRADETPAPRERNLGGIVTRGWSEKPVRFIPALVDAQCAQGRLWVTPPANDDDYWQPFGPGDYHIHNYALYYANLRTNAIDRVAAFRASQAAQRSPAPEF